MRKLFMFFVLAFIIFSCDLQDYWIYTVKNESARIISYKFNSGNVDTLEQSEVKTYQIKRGERHTGIGDVDAGNPYGLGYSVKIIHSGTNYTFIDNLPYDLHVANILPISVNIKADDNIDNNGSTELEIAANTENTTAKIYTNRPVFITTTNYPVIFDWQFVNDTVYLVIR